MYFTNILSQKKLQVKRELMLIKKLSNNYTPFDPKQKRSNDNG